VHSFSPTLMSCSSDGYLSIDECDEIGVIIAYMSDCHSVRASKIILLHVFTIVSIMCHVIKNWSIDNNKLCLYHH
jgi:hypothetical protein